MKKKAKKPQSRNFTSEKEQKHMNDTPGPSKRLTRSFLNKWCASSNGDHATLAIAINIDYSEECSHSTDSHENKPPSN